MRIVRWGAAAAAALTACVPLVAEAATPSAMSTAPQPSADAGSAVGSASATAKKVAAPPAPASSTPSAPAASAPSKSSSGVRSQSTTVTNPAPAGSAEAYAVQVGNVVALSHTSAYASGSGVSSTADPLELGGKPPAGNFGGTQNGPGSSSGALFDTNTTPLGRLALMPWTASNTGNTASGLADVVLVDLAPSGNQVASLRVLQSESNATWTPGQSTGSSSSDGAIVNVGGSSGLTLDVLHSQSSSTGPGSSYLLSVNGTPIGSSSQANGQCTLTIPSLLSLNCLTSSGGVGTTANGGTTLTSAGGVASATLGSAGTGLSAALIQSSSTSAKAPATLSPVTGTATAAPVPAVSSPASSAAPAAAAPPAAVVQPAAAAESGSLAFTGADIVSLLAAALALIGAGAGAVIFVRRPRAARQ